MKKQSLGVCYYPEHWSEELWNDDATRMKQVGIDFVRIGEFSWSRLEPSRRNYQFDWLEKAIQALSQKNLKIILSTPTATPPKWLIDFMPDMVALDKFGRPRKFGSRRHYCFSHEGYINECKEIVSKLSERFGNHPDIVAWQVDNEYGCHDTVESYSLAARKAFQNWCKEKYQNITHLNQSWGNVFWSMELSSFDEIDLPNLTVTEANPSHLLDFQRFSSDQVIKFNRFQVEILRKLSPKRDIIHNFMGDFTAFDHFNLCQDLDIASWDSYPLGFLERSPKSDIFKQEYMRIGDPDFQSFHHDLYRGCGRGRWWVMEQQPGVVNWAPWNPIPAKGSVRLWTHEAFAAGAEIVSYFRWRQAPFAQEQMHEGLLLPNSEPNEGYYEIAKVKNELESLKSVASSSFSPIALIFNYESAWAWNIQPHGLDFSYSQLILTFYTALRKLGLSIDIVPAEVSALGERELIIIPGLFSVQPEFIRFFENTKSTILAGPRTGTKSSNFHIENNKNSDFLSLLGSSVVRTESLRPGVEINIDNNCSFIHWREILNGESSLEPILSTEDGHAAFIQNKNIYYLAGWPNDQLAEHIVKYLLSKSNVKTLNLPNNIRVRDNGDKRYFFNYGSKSINIEHLIKDSEILIGQVSLNPYDVTIVRRSVL